MSFLNFLQVNGYDDILAGRFSVEDLVLAYKKSQTSGVRKPLFEAFKRGKPAGAFEQLVLRALKAAFPASLGAAATVIAVRNVNPGLTGMTLRTALMKFDDTCTPAVSMGGTVRQQSEDNTVVAKFYDDPLLHAQRLWLGGTPGNYTVMTGHAKHFARTLLRLVEPFSRDRGFNTHNTNYTKYAETRDAVMAVVGRIDSSAPQPLDDWKAQNALQWARLEACINFWDEELPRFRSRSAEITQLLNHQGHLTEVIQRFVSGAEVNAIRDSGFVQHGGKLEREKWFFGAGAQPGQGVQHEYVLRITVRAGTTNLLNQLAVDRASDGALSHVVYTKPNEPHCYGIHEDALGAFNALVVSVHATPRVGGQTVAVPLAPWAAHALGGHNDTLRNAVAAMLA